METKGYRAAQPGEQADKPPVSMLKEGHEITITGGHKGVLSKPASHTIKDGGVWAIIDGHQFYIDAADIINY
jgi:preprotein translocase subunit YajC